MNKNIFLQPKNRRFSGKKADLSINLIIVAIIALLVLVVTIFIFSGKMKVFGNSSDSCASKGGKCTSGSYADCIKTGSCECPESAGANAIFISGTDCEKPNSNICCKSVY